MSQRDVSLVIRAKDEASRAFELAAKAVEDLGRKGSAASGKFGEIANTLLAVDKAAGTLTGKFDAAASALSKNSADIDANKTRLAGLRAQMDSAAKSAEALRVAIVDATIGGEDTEGLRGKLRTVEAAMKSLQTEAAGLERTLGSQQTRYTASAAALDGLEGHLIALTAAQRAARAESDALTTSLERQQRAAAVGASIRRSTDSRTGKSAEDSASVFEAAGFTATEKQLQAEATDRWMIANTRLEDVLARVSGKSRALATASRDAASAAEVAAGATEAEAAAIQRLRNELNPLAVIEAKLAAETAKLVEWQRQGKITAQEYTAALKMLRDQADRSVKQLGISGIDSKGRPSLFGLNPNELTNLSYQINDVFTQIASGTSVMQTLAQQGGQIIQIFPRIGGVIAEALKPGPFLLLAATVGVFIAAIARAADEAERLRAFEGLLTTSADGGAFDAKALAASARAIQDLGLNAEKAVGVVRQLVRDGIDPSRLDAFARTAQEMSEVLGIDAVDAARQLGDAFTGGYDAVRKLDESLNFLTDAQRESIKALFEQGRAAEAVDEAQRILSQRMDEAAEKARGPWKDAVLSLKTAWSNMLGALSDTGPVVTVIGLLDDLARKITIAVGGVQRLNVAQIDAEIAQAKTSLASSQRTLDQSGPLLGIVSPISAIERANAEYQRMRIRDLQKAREEITRTEATEDRAAGSSVTNAQRRAKATRDLNERIREQGGEIEGASAKERIASAEAKARREAQRDVEDDRFKFADAAAKQAYVAQSMAKARAAEEKKIASEMQAQARAAERTAREREREAKFTQFRSPVDGQVTSGFGLRSRPNAEASRYHTGIDIAVPVGTPVRAPADGVVIERGVDPKLGKFVYIDHGNKVVSKFGHLSDNETVSVGQVVSQGQVIAKSGNTGNSTGPHLHYAISENGKYVDPRTGKFKINTGDAVADYEADGNKLADERAKQQERFNRRLDDEAERRQQNITHLREQLGLEGEALLAAQRKEAVDEAVLRAQQELDRVNEGLALRGAAEIEMTEAQRKAIEELTAAEFDLAHARDVVAAKRNETERDVDAITSQRDALRQQAEILRGQGRGDEADALEDRLAGVNEELRSGIDNLIAFYEGLTAVQMVDLGLTAEQIEAIVIQLQNAKLEAFEYGRIFGVSFKEVADMATSAATSALDRFGEAIANGKNAFGALLGAFRAFLADFLRGIAQAIQQQLIFNLVSGLLKSIGGGLGSFGGGIGGGAGAIGGAANGFGAIGGVLAHGGGVIGGAGPTPRLVRPAWFATAMRYHGGGIAGLAPDEVPAILRRGEEVLREDDPRHRGNGGAGGGGRPLNVKVINAIDAGDMVQKGLASKAGEKAILNFIRDNPGAVRQAMGG